MSSQTAIQNRLTFEEARLETLNNQVSLTKATIEGLKAELVNAAPEKVKKDKKSSDGLPLVEVRLEDGYEICVFSDGVTSKIETYPKTETPADKKATK